MLSDYRFSTTDAPPPEDVPKPSNVPIVGKLVIHTDMYGMTNEEVDDRLHYVYQCTSGSK